MQIHLVDQSAVFPAHLTRLAKEPILRYSPGRLPEKDTIIPVDRALPLTRIDTTFLTRYAIFPPRILTALPQWISENREIQVGDTIVQQIALPPLPCFSLKLITGVRISEVIREPGRIGFSYETLRGHVERGISTFTLEQAADGAIRFRIRTFSEPAAFLTRLLGPVFTVPYQSFCTRQALRCVKKHLECFPGPGRV